MEFHAIEQREVFRSLAEVRNASHSTVHRPLPAMSLAP